MREKFSALPWRSALTYGVVAALWILLSDRLLAALVGPSPMLTTLQTYKGWAFVAVTTGLLYFGLRHRMQRIAEEAGAHRQAEAKLRESERRYQTLTEVSPVGIFQTDAQGGTIYVNPRWCQISGLSAPDALRTGWLRAVHPDDRAKLARGWQEAVRTHRLSIADYRFVRPDGSVVWVMGQAVPEKDASDRIVGYVGTITDVTARKEAEAALQTREEQLSRVYENVHDILFVIAVAADGDFRFESVNRQFLAATGLAESQIVGQRVVAVIPATAHSLVLGNYRQAISTRRPVTWEEISVYPTGQKCGVVTVAPVFDPQGRCTHLIGAVHDITERKIAEEALRASEAYSRRLSVIIESTPDFVGIADVSGHVLYLSPGGRRMVALADDADVSRLSIADFHPPEVATRLLTQAMPAAAQTGRWSGETVVRTRAGVEVAGLQVVVAHKNAGGEVECYSTIIHDLTAQKKLEAQLLRTQRLESVGQLASGIAHDLNNILAPILMAAPLLKEAVRDPAARKILDIVNANAWRGAAIVKQLLTFSRGLDGRRAPLQLKSLLHEMEMIITETFPKNIRARVERPPEPWLVNSDPTQLHQVLMNLCLNARDAMPNGGTLTLGVENAEVDAARAVTVPGAAPGRYVILSVTDTGTGIPAEILDKIYDPFFTTKEVGRGTGLGLSTVLGIVKSHQGFVQLQTELGRGTRFQVYLPACAAEDTAPTPASQSTLPQGTGELILVVDDEQNVRQVTRHILEAYGYRVVDFGAATAALDWYARHGSEARVVISDMVMPEMDGATFIRKLRHLNPQVRVIAASGNQPEVGEIVEIGAEAQARLLKPFTVDTLLRTLGRVLRSTEPSTPLG